LTFNGERRGGQRLEQREDRKLVQKIQEGLKRLADLEDLPGASSFFAAQLGSSCESRWDGRPFQTSLHAHGIQTATASRFLPFV
jgi:hypothetical protein